MTTTFAPSLFDAPAVDPAAVKVGPSRRDGHRTERAAADTAKQRKAAIRLRVLGHIAGAGDHGSTDVETEAALGLTRPSGSNRRGELARDGLVVDSGRTRATSTGCKAIVWVLTDEGRKALEQTGAQR